MSELSQDMQVLLAGLEVGSIEELRRLVGYGRGLVVTPNQREAIEAMYPGQPVLVRGAERHGYFVGAIHTQRTDDDNEYGWLNAGVMSADCTKQSGHLGISYDTLMKTPRAEEER